MDVHSYSFFAGRRRIVLLNNFDVSGYYQLRRENCNGSMISIANFSYISIFPSIKLIITWKCNVRPTTIVIR